MLGRLGFVGRLLAILLLVILALVALIAGALFASRMRAVDTPPRRPLPAIAGKVVPVSTESEAEFVRLCGGIPRIISAAAQFDAYAKGELTAGSRTIASVAARRYWEVTKFVTFTGHRTAESVVTINVRLWQSLSAKHKRVMEGAARKAEVALRGRMSAIEREARAVAEKNGMKMVELAKEEEDQWKFCAAPMAEAYLEGAGDLGARVMSGYQELLTENIGPPILAK